MAKAAPKPTAKPTSSDDQERLSGWQQRALDRSLVEAKRRALDKSNGFVKAAMALLDETGTLNFTVQDVVDRSKLSLRSFYQTFASKDDLLLALFEEYVATAADWQRDRMAKHDDPVDQIRDFLTSLWVGKLSPDVVRALAVYNMTLSSTRPADLAHALEPQLLVLLEAVERGIASGQVRDDIGSRRLAEILLHTGNAAVQTTILHTGSESPDDVWAFCLGGLRRQA
ncbi:MAG TPA: TetR/AcrR family transcriptional regulator [Acidimicrobiia bacterium]|nr:TetR/AcrR family transcriptional regulator [Acidimicrobiia bacterium]